VLVHEVRSPVAALVAVSEALAADGLEIDERRELAALAVAACRSIDRVVTDLAPTSVRFEAVDAGRLVRESVAAAAIAGESVRAEVMPGLPAISADPVRLRQALDNLVENALVHGGRHGDVVVRATLEGGDVALVVEDSGPGIRAEDHARIFEAGVRLATERPGTGLGLAIARGVAGAHGGTLDVGSTPGGGATFTLRIPVA
jgi:two-component system sensor histidine kinase BaeS